jgi:hypothetical protein
VLRVYAAFLMFAVGGASVGVAIADAPREGVCDEGAGCVPTLGLSETLFFVMLVGGVLITLVGVVAIYAAFLRRSESLD